MEERNTKKGNRVKKRGEYFAAVTHDRVIGYELTAAKGPVAYPVAAWISKA